MTEKNVERILSLVEQALREEQATASVNVRFDPPAEACGCNSLCREMMVARRIITLTIDTAPPPTAA